MYNMYSVYPEFHDLDMFSLSRYQAMPLPKLIRFISQHAKRLHKERYVKDVSIGTVRCDMRTNRQTKEGNQCLNERAV